MEPDKLQRIAKLFSDLLRYEDIPVISLTGRTTPAIEDPCINITDTISISVSGHSEARYTVTIEDGDNFSLIEFSHGEEMECIVYLKSIIPNLFKK